MQEKQVHPLGWEDPLGKEMATHSSILAWDNPMVRGAWRATVHGVVKESDMTQRLNNNTLLSDCLLPFLSPESPSHP